MANVNDSTRLHTVRHIIFDLWHVCHDCGWSVRWLPLSIPGNSVAKAECQCTSPIHPCDHLIKTLGDGIHRHGMGRYSLILTKSEQKSCSLGDRNRDRQITVNNRANPRYLSSGATARGAANNGKRFSADPSAHQLYVPCRGVLRPDPPKGQEIATFHRLQGEAQDLTHKTQFSTRAEQPSSGRTDNAKALLHSLSRQESPVEPFWT